MKDLLGIPGLKATPFFKNRAEYERFREDFRKQIEPELKAQRRARQQSEVWAMTHFVD
jgi:predicted RNase H-like nuclease